MIVITIYCWGVGICSAIGVALGWRKGMPLISNYRRSGVLPADVLELVVVMLCFALLWPVLLVSRVSELWKR